MSRRQHGLGTALVLLGLALVLPLSACSEGAGGTGTPGVGTFTVLTFTPNPVPGGAATPFTITGVGFETLVGTTALVRFDAQGVSGDIVLDPGNRLVNRGPDLVLQLAGFGR